MNQEIAKNIFEYRNGELYWNQPKRRIKVGNKVGWTDYLNYRTTEINGKSYKVHKLIFLMFYGYMPKYIDHIDGNPANNKIENLREVTHSQNMMNSKKKKNNTTGYKNILIDKKSGKYRVQIRHNKKIFRSSLQDSLEKAILIAKQQRAILHGEYSREL
jgi:hypothetical protein